MKKLSSNTSYILLVGCFTFLYGIYTTLGAVVASLTAPYGYTAADNSIFGATFILCGVLGSFIFGVILDKYAKYLLILRLICFASSATIFLAMITLPLKHVALFAFTMGIVGLAVVPIIPLCYSFAVELTYPLSEAMSNGMMVLFS